MSMHTNRFRAGLSLALGLLAAAPLAAQGLEPKPLPPRDPIKARSAEENVVSGQVYDDKDKRLDVRDRLDGERGLTPPVGPRVIYPEDLPELDTPAVVDVAPVPEVNVGLEVRTSQTGLQVVRVAVPSPAEDAGFKTNDLIKRIADRAAVTPKDLHETLNRFPPLAQVSFDVERGSEKLQLILTLPADHEQRSPPPPWGTGPPNKISKLDQSRYVYRDPWLGWVISGASHNVVQVMAVQTGTAAHAAGLQSRDFILTVDGIAVYDAETLIELVHRHFGGDQIPLVVRRNGADAATVLMMPTAAPQFTTDPASAPVNPGVGNPGVVDPAGPVPPAVTPTPNGAAVR